MQTYEEEKKNLLLSGEEFFDLSMINPDLQPARFVLDRLLEASINPRNHRYAVSRGVRKAREGFAKKYQDRFQVTLDPESQVCITSGSKDAVLQYLSVSCEPGDVVLLGTPTYPAYLSALSYLNLRPAFFCIASSEGETLQNLSAALQAHKPKCILLNFPHNPTGMVVSRSFFHEVLQLSLTHSLPVYNDFVYGEMGLSGATPVSLLSAWDGNESAPIGESYSLSKAYSVPGWRVGAIVGSSRLITEIGRLKAQIDYGLFLPIQMAAGAILSSSESINCLATSEYERRSRMMVNGLQRLGWDCRIPQAGACIWARPPGISHTTKWCIDLMRQHQVVLTPGELFGAEYSTWVRIALVRGDNTLREVLERLGGSLGQSASAA